MMEQIDVGVLTDDELRQLSKDILDVLGEEDMRQLSKDIDEVLKDRAEKKRTEAAQQIKAIAAGVGMTVDEVLGKGKSPRKRRQSKPAVESSVSTKGTLSLKRSESEKATSESR